MAPKDGDQGHPGFPKGPKWGHPSIIRTRKHFFPGACTQGNQAPAVNPSIRRESIFGPGCEAPKGGDQGYVRTPEFRNAPSGRN